MRICEVVEKVKLYYRGSEEIKEETTRDRILYGDPDKECTGVVVTCFASVDVIKKAAAVKANLIICHEALFWNHGDRTDWLQDNQTFLEKKRLLDDTGIVVWRNHDYIHTGLPLDDGSYSDGIFYGFMKAMGWENCLTGDIIRPLLFEIPETTAEELGRDMIQRFHLNGMKLIGNRNAKVRKVCICEHVMGRDNDMIAMAERDDINLLISLELVDFTLTEYVRDAAMQGKDKAILAMGHFNAEEPGMQYMTAYLSKAAGEELACSFIQSGDMYQYL